VQLKKVNYPRLLVLFVNHDERVGQVCRVGKGRGGGGNGLRRGKKKGCI